MSIDPVLVQSLRRYFTAVMAREKPPAQQYPTPVAAPRQAHAVIENFLLSPNPAMICRWGNNELALVIYWLQLQGGLITSVPLNHFSQICLEAGFFPARPELTPDFAQIMLQAFRQADCIGVWNDGQFNPHEDYIIANYAPRAALIPLDSISPAQQKRPWSRALAGKRVLIIHPFAESIKAQYRRRTELFNNPHVLPEFDLQVVKAVQSHAGSMPGFDNWLKALAHMQDEISERDFDVALIGAGAYGMPLAAHVKGLGKKAVHMGGVLQILFGIMGGRWETRAYREARQGWRLENWVRPRPDETPSAYKAVEDGCYW